MEVLEIQVPGLQPGDHLTHVYVLTFFGEHGLGSSQFFPDESGYAQVEMPADFRVEMPADFRAGPEVARQQIFYSMHVETEELLLTLDLVGVRLDALVNALYNTRHSAGRTVGILYGERPNAASISSFAQVSMNNQLIAADRRLSLSGASLTLEETLDGIYQQSGCLVVADQEWLTIEQCR